MRKWLVQGLAPILCGLAVLISAISAGRAARAALHDRAAYRLSFSDIECQPPEGLARDVFLNEVRSLACQPGELNLLDEDTKVRLERSFLAHPWVESVRLLTLPSRGTPAKKSVHVELEFRQPVLALPRSAEVTSGVRLVDQYGILLPEKSVLAQVPILTGTFAAPDGPSEGRWRDARVAIAAKTVAFLQPYLAKLGLADSQIEVRNSEIIFRHHGVRIVWGHAPGQEKEDEAPAQVKLQRLLDYQSDHNGLDRLEHDVRFVAYQGHFPLAPEELHHSISLYEPSQPPSRRNRDQVSNSSPDWRSRFNDAKPPSASASSR